jgi:hypothetical protein
MVTLTTAFDVSVDEPEKRFLVMAGFVSDAHRWKEFDSEWRKRLAADGVPYFHMNPFAQSRKHFLGWDKQESRRQGLLADLLDIISSHAYYKFGVIVQSEAAKAVASTFQMNDMMMIEVAGGLIACDVEQWRQRNGYRNKAEHIFEDGDLGKGRLIKAIKTVTGSDPIFRSKKDIPDKNIVGFTPLQAADILAFEIKKLASEVSLENGQIPLGHHFRFPYQQLNRIQGQPRLWNIGSSSDVDELAGVYRYFIEHPLGGTVQ